MSPCYKAKYGATLIMNQVICVLGTKWGTEYINVEQVLHNVTQSNVTRGSRDC